MKHTVTLGKEFTFEAAHHLEGMPANHPCGRVHGHSYKVGIEIVTPYDAVDKTGMIIDVGLLEQVRLMFDHKDLNEVLPKETNPTVENLAKSIWQGVMDMLFKLGCDESTYVARLVVFETATVYAVVQFTP